VRGIREKSKRVSAENVPSAGEGVKRIVKGWEVNVKRSSVEFVLNM